MRRLAIGWACGLLALIFAGCEFGRSPIEPRTGFPYADFCARSTRADSLGEQGQGHSFLPDPLTQSGDLFLTPTSPTLSSYQQPVTLEGLAGTGVLDSYDVQVLNGLHCNMEFGSYAEEQDFRYDYGDPRFQEVMTYYFAKEFRTLQSDRGYFHPNRKMPLIAHCMRADNAYYARIPRSDGTHFDYVCMGDSVYQPGASFSDDAVVTVHELQHGATIDLYSPTESLNQFNYDEAGAMNEALSDFFSLSLTEPMVHPSLDPKSFSRWALGRFFPGNQAQRGAHHCPTYDSSFPNCTATEFSSENNSILYHYPDGLGWPYSNNFDGPNYVQDAFRYYRGQEAVHNNGNIILGAIWDLYEPLSEPKKANFQKLVWETTSHLPKPTLDKQSPVRFIDFGHRLIDWAETMGWSVPEVDTFKDSLRVRGLYDEEQLGAGWLALGPEKLRVQDAPNILAAWLWAMGYPTSMIPQSTSTGGNRQFDPNELVAVWVDIQNQDVVTAGGLEVDVEVISGEVEVDGSGLNRGYVSNKQVEMLYSKVNGSRVVGQLASTDPDFHVATGTRYFQTNPFFDQSTATAIWLRVLPGAQSGDEVVLRVTVHPSNGPTESIDLTMTVQ